MNSFNYYNPARIIFGSDALEQIESLLAAHKASRILFIYNGQYIKDLGIYDGVKKACFNLNITFLENDEVVPNPKVELVRELIKNCQDNQVDFIIAAGGGSAIDTAKAVAAGALYDGDVWDFFVNNMPVEKALPIGCITTIPASGSESSNAAIISNGLHKLGIEFDCLIPKFAIMNPQYTLTLPSYQTACGIADILSHMLERYFSNTKHVDTTDYLIEGAIKALMLNGLRLVKNPQDLNARSEIQCLAFLAHNSLLDIGRETDWASHRIEHELSAQYGITHGEGMAIISLAWMRYMAIKHPFKLAQLANRVFNIDPINYTDSEMALLLVNEFEKFFHALSLKTSLTQVGITNEHYDMMVQRATKNNTQTIGRYVTLNKEAIFEILKLAE